MATFDNGDTVQSNWGSGTGEGTVQDVYTERVEKPSRAPR